jgi:3-dehydroquinate dehydratase II
MSKPIYVLSGPNLNLLGSREPHIYGSTTLEDIRALCEARAAALGHTIVFRQSNHEGELIDWVQEAGREAAALVLNPAGYGHTSVALLDALKTLSIPIVECHLSNPAARETFRHTTYVSLAATGVVSGFGATSYELALEACAGLLASAKSSARNQGA